MLAEKINGTNPLRRPRIRWINTVAKDPRAMDRNVNYDPTYGRERRRGLVKAAMVLNGPVNREEETEKSDNNRNSLTILVC